MTRWTSAPELDILDRQLFARRLRAMGPAPVPSLDSVLEAAERARLERAHDTRRARGQAIVAMVASVMAVSVTNVSHLGVLPAGGPVGASSEDETSTCVIARGVAPAEAETPDEGSASMSVQPPACYSLEPTSSLATSSAPAVPAASREMPAPFCASDGSCAIAPP